METHKLLHPLRMDICIKHAYARLRSQAGDLPWAQKIYSEHIMAMNNAHEQSSPKNNLQDFYDHFHALLDSVEVNGWNTEKKIPVDKHDNTHILNGAHRVAACLLHKIDTPTRIHPNEEKWYPDYSYAWLASRGVSIEVLDFMALEYVQLRPDCKLAIVWPAAAPHINLIESIFAHHSKIIYRKKLQAKGNSAFNIIRQVYVGERIIGTAKNQFGDTMKKATNYFAGGTNLHCYVLQADSPDTMNQMKIKVRNKTRMANDAMHTTDTHEETLRISKMLFNQNSTHFLHYAQPDQSPEFIKRLADYKKAVGDKNDFAIHGSGVMEAYGIRAANDLDYISTGGKLKTTGKISRGNDKVKYGNLSLAELIHDPRNYFYYNGIKFVSLSVVAKMKKLRNETKDIVDVELIDTHINTIPDKFVFSSGIGNLVRSEMKLARRTDSDRRKKREQKMQIAVVGLIILLIASLVLK